MVSILKIIKNVFQPSNTSQSFERGVGVTSKRGGRTLSGGDEGEGRGCRD